MLSDLEALEQMKLVGAHVEKSIEELVRMERMDFTDYLEETQKAHPDFDDGGILFSELALWAGSQPLKWKAMQELGIDSILSQARFEKVRATIKLNSINSDLLHLQHEAIPGIVMIVGDLFVVELPDWRKY